MESKEDTGRSSFIQEEQEELMQKRIPAFCPFCERIDAVLWHEFEVTLGTKFYFSTDKPTKKHTIGASIVVFCTRCDEEVREEDLPNATSKSN